MVDLTGRQVLPLLLPYATARTEPAGVQAMLAQLQTWLNAGAPRKKAAASNAQYANAAAVAIMDELAPRLDRAIFDHLFQPGGLYQINGMDAGYNKLLMEFADNPSTHGGSSYYDGFEGYLWKALRQLTGQPVAKPFTSTTTTHLCGNAGLSDCGAAIDQALLAAYNALVTANGNSNVSSWTQDTGTKTLAVNMPAYDAIQFTGVGVVGQPAMDWQNRPTFQQVVEFP